MVLFILLIASNYFLHGPAKWNIIHLIHLHEKYYTNSLQMQITIIIIFWARLKQYNSHKIISIYMNKPCSWSSLSFCNFWASVILWKSLEANTAFFPNSLCIAMMASSATCPSFKSQILNPYFLNNFSSSSRFRGSLYLFTEYRYILMHTVSIWTHRKILSFIV